ncbi:MAG: hypothetical protein WCC17_04485 [Candidatus Nitrosopolaris sp.]
MTEIPPNATIRQEYVKCGIPDCQNQHGPYLYAYWKEDKKLNKRYVGKNFEAFRGFTFFSYKLRSDKREETGHCTRPERIMFSRLVDSETNRRDGGHIVSSISEGNNTYNNNYNLCF